MKKFSLVKFKSIFGGVFINMIKEKYKLTHPQKRIWCNEQIFPKTSMHNIVSKVNLGKGIDIGLLKRTINLIIQKNDSLRMKFYEEDGEPYQYIEPYEALDIQFIDFSEKGEEAEKSLNEFCTDNGKNIIYKEKEFLFKLYIYKLSNDNIGVCFFIHHIIIDGTGINIMIEQLKEIYNKLENQEFINGDVEESYIDFINFEKNYLNSEEFLENRKFWNKKFLDLNETSLYINPDSVKSDIVKFSLGNKEKAIKKFIKENKISLNRFFISIISIYMAKRFSTDDVTLATATFNRFNEKHRNTLGMFTGIMPLRIDLNDDYNYDEFLKNVTYEIKSCYKNQKYPYDLLVQDLELKKKGFDSLFTCCVNYYTFGSCKLDEEEYIENHVFTQKYSNIPLQVFIKEFSRDESIEIEIHYRLSDHTKEEIIAMFNGFKVIIDQVIDNSKIKLSNLEIISEEEKNKILRKFNGTFKKYEKYKTLKELFEEVALDKKDEIVVVAKGKEISYDFLNKKGNQVANFLRKKGIKENSIVPIVCDRSVETIIGILGIIKSGGAYLPIDEDYPKARIKYMIEDCKSRIVLSPKSQLFKIDTSLWGIDVIEIDGEDICKEKSQNIKTISSYKDLAYVIYTSGSTGNPKGVCIGHRSVGNLIMNQHYVDFDKNDKMLQCGSLSFDASVFQVWFPLLNGVPLYLEDNSLIIDNLALKKYIDKNKITIIFMPTPLFNQHSRNNIEIFENLSCVIAGGDVLLSKELSRLTEMYKNLKVVNGYGPTENTVLSTVYEVKGGWNENKVVPIGSPLLNTTAYIMDKNNRLLPIGIPGEVCVGGDGLSVGYLNREELTKSKFIENPYVTGERIYKTGDLAKWLPDGNIHFIGRIDHQVKIRGFRVELGEIENKLLKYPNIKIAAVVDKKDKEGNKYLCGYIVSKEKIDIKDLRKFLKKDLPNYMVPLHIMQLDKMPTNHNGKIDRKKLPVPETTEETIKIIEPRNDIEKKLHNIWCDILNINKLSVEDNFFELGGHSLTAINLVAKINKEFNIKINVSDIFNRPTIEEIAQFLMIQTINGLKDDFINDKSIKKVDKREYYEASAVQKRMYAVNQKEINNTNYNMPFAYIIKGKFDKNRFKEAFYQVINRHEALRTSFHIVDDNIVQKIHDKVDLKVEFLQINKMSNENISEIYEYIKPFDLEKAPLIRSLIIEVKDGNIVLIDMHHIISDGISIALIMDELSSIYNKRYIDKPIIQYKDFSCWQNDLYKKGLLNRQEEYWINKLKGEIPVINMPLDHKKTSHVDFNGDTIEFEIDKEIYREVDKGIKDLGMTKYMFYLAVLDILIYKYTGQKDFIVGTPASGRTNEDVKNTVGMFVNTLPLRVIFEDNIKFKEFLELVKTNSLEAFENQDYDLKNIFEKLNLNKNSMFDILFSFQNQVFGVLDLEGTKVSKYKLRNNISKFDISMILEDRGEYISGTLEYRNSLYSKEKINNFIEHYKNILKVVIKDLNIPINKINILSQDETNLILNKFNDTKRLYRDTSCVKEIFEETILKVKDREAIISNGKTLTFNELNKKSNQLARILRKKGVLPNDIVPIICDRSMDAVIGMLAIIKSGAAYLPIDEEYPVSRVKYMIEDSNSKIILVKSKHLSKFRLDNIDIEKVNLNSNNLLEEPTENLDNINDASDLAYVIYTSGSTGKPKGVCISHKNIINLTIKPTYIDIRDNDRVLQSGSLSFDISVFQIWMSLLNGLPLHIESSELIVDGKALESYIDRNKITIMLMPTPLFNEYGESNISVFKNLNNLLVGGDVLSSKLLSKVTQKYGKLKIINGYGPTENTVLSTVYEVKEAWDENISVPIGVPVSNSTAYIMDNNMNLLPVGVVGELCVGGAGIGKGYLNKEELTKEKFINNPYVKNEMIYKTGDLAKWLPDGNIEFLGRKDYQVKIRGFRIELGEIEKQIAKYDRIKEVIVIDKTDDKGDKYLCGYITSDFKISISDLKNSLKNFIPIYMIPSKIIQIETMPTNCNGKIDRKLLPDPTIFYSDVSIVKPRNKVEEELLEIWCELFNKKIISIEDNFFELGGNSLNAISLASRIYKKFNINIKVSEIFNKSSIKELGEYISNLINNDQCCSGVKLNKIKRILEADFYETSAVQKRMYALNEVDKNNVNYNMPFIYLLEGKVDTNQFEKAVCDIINRHEALRTTFHVINGEIVQKVHQEIDYKTEYITIKSNFDYNKYDFYKHIRPFDLNKGPLIRSIMIKFYDINVLIIDMHHIISDGISSGIIMRELSYLYNGKEVLDIDIQYKDFANWQNRLYNGGLLKEQERYWREKLKGDLSPINMQQDYKVVSSGDFRGNTITFELDETLTKKVDKLISDSETTRFMFYASIFNILLYKYTGQKDLIIGVPSSGRTNEYVRNIVGMFVNTLPLRTIIEENMNFKELLNMVKINSLEAFENQDYDLMNIIKITDNKLPLFDVSFSIQNLDNDKLEFNEIEISQLNIKNKKAKFNISMVLEENDAGILCSLEYKTSLYTEERMRSFINHYKNIINEVVKNVDIPIKEIDIISEKEKELILHRFNDTKCSYPCNSTIKELFEGIVNKYENKFAVVSKGRKITFRELNEKSNQLAHLLRNLGVGKDSIVPIICYRDIETVVAMVAVIKAGGSYLPIDEDYPEARVRYIIKDCQCKVILGKEEKFKEINITELKLTLVDFYNKQTVNESLDNLEDISTSRDLAYVIYTSGSTGNPKGVCIENRSLIKIIKNTNYYSANESDKLLQSGSLSFDASVQQIWIALLNGITIHVESKDLILDFPALEEYVCNNKITMLILPTTLFNKLAEERIAVFKNISYVIAGGDVISSKQVSRIVSKYKEISVVNGYGPTENTIISTAFKVRDRWDEDKPIPIGRPISNSTAYIMDNENKLLPIGVVGELCVGGDGLSSGYLNNIELTREKFIRNPYSKDEIIYKTGDLAKWLPDGNIEFIGRKDHQVKINGFRIEMGEIENILLRHDKIKEAAVICNNDRNSSKYLCAYVTTKYKVEEGDIIKFLKTQLPNYMIPKHIVVLEDMPKTSNGKLDRKSLSSIKVNYKYDNYKAPITEVEEKIWMAWCKVLGSNDVSIDSSFFEIGGDSLKAISVVSILSLEFNISINDLFKYVTIEELAKNIRKKTKKEDRLDNTVEEIIANTVEDEILLNEEITETYNKYKKSVKDYDKLSIEKNNYNNILLTGATGYVGINILKELLLSTNANMFLLLRGANKYTIEERFMKKINFYFGKDFYNKYKNRLRIINGDMTKENLGLNEENYKKLSLQVDCVINSAANVKHYGKYEDFYNTNVLGVRHLVHFSKEGKNKDFNQISTISIASGNIANKKSVLFSENNVDMGQLSDNVYIQTKLEAEKVILAMAKEYSINVKIFRVGNVTFNYETGRFQENIKDNGFYQSIRSFIKLNCAPNINEDILDFCFVDELSRAICLILNRRGLNNEIFHIENPNKLSISNLVNKLHKKFGDIEIKEIRLFKDYILSQRENEKIKEYVNNVIVHLGLLNNEVETKFIVVSDRTNFILNKLNFRWSLVDEEAIERMIRYCEEISFI